MEPLTDTAEAPGRMRARPIPQDAKALVLFNPKAGSVSESDREKLVEAVQAAGVAQYVLVGAEKISRALFARASHFDVIIVLGGDGTARAAAELAPRDGPPLVLLPGGTLNILPHALYGADLAWPEALAAALERGRVTRLPTGRANGKKFYVAALFGAPTLLARAREAVREGKWVTATRRLSHFLGRAFNRSLRSRPDRETPQKAEAIGMLCPSFSGELEGDTLEWVRLDAKHIIDLARVGLRSINQGWRNDSTVEVRACRSCDIVSLAMIPATLDGEPTAFLSRVHVSYHPRGPRVIALDRDEA